jgi:hypothetical protein
MAIQMSMAYIPCQSLWPRVLPACAGMTFDWHRTYETDI